MKKIFIYTIAIIAAVLVSVLLKSILIGESTDPMSILQSVVSVCIGVGIGIGYVVWRNNKKEKRQN